MTRDAAQVQAVARLLAERVVIICAHCGQPDTNTTDGRRRHQLLHDHALSGTDNRKEGR